MYGMIYYVILLNVVLSEILTLQPRKKYVQQENSNNEKIYIYTSNLFKV